MDFRLVLIYLITFSLQAWGTASSIQLQILDQGDSAHLEFSGLKEWKYSIQKKSDSKENVIEILIPALSVEQSKKLNQFKNSQITKIDIEKNKTDGQDLLRFSLSDKSIESFDYLTDQPSRLIIDFFAENEKAKSKVASSSATNTDIITVLPKKLSSNEEKLVGKPEKFENIATRKPSSTDIILIKPEPAPLVIESSLAAPKNISSYNLFDGGDPNYERFLMPVEQMREDAQLRAQENEYIDFPAIQVPLVAWQRVEANKPMYEIVPANTEENKTARLLKTLYEKQRHRVFEKTYNWFKEKYPQSEYMEIATYMLADLKLKRWREEGRQADFDEAIKNYKAMVAEHPKSNLAERTSLLVGFLYQERNDHLNAIRAFQTHVESKNFVGDKFFSRDVAKLGQALSYLKLREFDQALNSFKDVEKNSLHAALREDASYRRGDVHFSSKKYTDAISEYQSALRNFPHRKTDYPNSHFNQAESFFKTNKFKDALFTHVDFLKNYPVQEFTPYVLTRVAELLQILGSSAEKVNGALMETAFRFGESPKTLVARIRLLTKKMNSMKPKDVDVAIKQVFELAKKSELNNVEQFSTLLIADGLNDRKDFSRAIQLLTNYYQQNPTGVDHDKFRRKIAKNAVDEINHHITQGDFIKTLRQHQQYADNWLKNTDRLDLKYDLGRAYELAGVFDKSSDLYQGILNELLSIQGTDLEKKKSVVERLPQKERVMLRLAQVEVQKKEWQRAWDFLRQIKRVDLLEPQEQVERVQLAVDLLMRRGEKDTAKKYLVDLIEHWSGKTELIAEPSLQLAELEKEQNNFEAALETLKKLDLKIEESGLSPSEFQARTLQKIIDLYISKKQDDNAIPYFDKYLKIYENNKSLASVRYKYGQVFFQKGEMKKASEIWADIKGDKSDFWKKLADERLRNADFEGNYKKYIQRIPAMSSKNEEVKE